MKSLTTIRVLCAALAASILAVSAYAQPGGNPRKAKIKAVSYNLYFGASIFRVFDPPLCGVPQAVADIYSIIQATNFPERAEAIADQILAEEPHVIGLQEVSVIRTQFPGNSLSPDGSGIEFLGDFPTDPRFTFKTDASDVQYDFLQILLDALAARGLHYVAIEMASPTNADVEFPAIEYDDACNPLTVPTDVRLTDRDVILVRDNLDVNYAFEDNFQFNAPIALPTSIPTPGGLVPAVYVAEFTRGYGAVGLTIKDQDYSIVNTHLEVGDEALPPDQGLNLVQFAQALELGAVAGMLPTPRLVVGDINSSPDSGVTDPRPAYFVLTQAFGLLDIWSIQDKMPAIPGYTCCQAETLDNVDSALDQRIDVILADFGLLVPEKIKADVLGDEPGDKTASGLWPSDHAGVSTKLTFER